MRPVRALAGSLLWILSGVLGLVGALLSVTVILLPLGIPLLMLARRLFRYSMVFFLPRAVRHPAQEAGKSVMGGVDEAIRSAKVPKPIGKKARKKAGEKAKKSAKKTGKKVAKRGRKLLGR